MASTFTAVLLHVVFSTKDRQPTVDPAIANQLYAYIGGACKANGSELLLGGGMPDHIHLLVSLGKTVSIADLLQGMKKESSKWMKLKGARRFAWQDGYGAFSIGESQREALERYIRNQARHHAKMTFPEEIERLLKKYKVVYDPRFLLG